jgi:hypothetical protein
MYNILAETPEWKDLLECPCRGLHERILLKFVITKLICVLCKSFREKVETKIPTEA